MGRIKNAMDAHRPRVFAWASCLSLLFVLHAGSAFAAPVGKVQGRILATDNAEPVGFADLLLIPADTTMRRVGAFTNADGTYLIEAAPGRYTLKIRALSYLAKTIEGILVEEGKLTPFSTALAPEAILQEEIVIEAKALQNTESAMLSARRKAASVGDAVSAEQVRKAPDKDAAEVLRRVTGLSVSEGKYVFVRGLGERYSSTEVDGVRIASPEQNKRVVPLDLLPANLLDNITVQKTYTADRPGEFGGGDVQVRTKDFPGSRSWSVSISEGAVAGTTGKNRRIYSGASTDLFGFGADSRAMPDIVRDTPIPGLNARNASSYQINHEMARAFSNTWGPREAKNRPNASYGITYGDEFKLFGRPLGLIESWTLSRNFKEQRETQRFYEGAADAIKYDYDVNRSTASVQLGGISGLSYRLSPRHTLHARGLYSNSSDDEVRVYEGTDFNSTGSNGEPLVKRNTRFQYTERSVMSLALEGQHEFQQLLGTSLNWKFSRSRANRLQPNRREFTYNRQFYGDDVPHWVLGSGGSVEFGDLSDDGWGTTVTASAPYRLFGLGKGRVSTGFDRQSKHRHNFYRRFSITPNGNVDRELPVDTLFAPGGFSGAVDPLAGYIEDVTTNDPVVGLDNYRANQRVEAGFLSADVPLGPRVRANIGLRVEHGFQNVQSFALFAPGRVLAEGRLDNTDWLPSANATFTVTEAVSVRAAASRTLSRPDLNEMSTSPTLEYVGGMLVKGNPNLRRAKIENYDLRVEAYPGLSEVLAAGVFYKRLTDPIEQRIIGGTPLILAPVNSEGGKNYGLELEARFGLARAYAPLKGFSLNSNASFIQSEVRLGPAQGGGSFGSAKHPLQGQAKYLLNAALSYAAAGGKFDVSVLAGETGRRLVALGSGPVPDVYQNSIRTLDATVNFAPIARGRVKLAAKNILDPRVSKIQGANEVSGYRSGRSYSLALSYSL
jgi:outer membrane receptor protein involved in Fe transport